MREVGLGYGTTEFYQDIKEVGYPTPSGMIPRGEDQQVSPFLEEGLHPIRYDVWVEWKDPGGEYVDEEGVSWRLEGRSVWADKFETPADVLAKCKAEVLAAIEAESQRYLERYGTLEPPDAYELGGHHVYEKHVFTKEPFVWR